jgi:hypothetical protein
MSERLALAGDARCQLAVLDHRECGRAFYGSPALSMTAAPLRLRTNEKLLENADRCAGWRPPIIESAGEPR